MKLKPFVLSAFFLVCVQMLFAQKTMDTLVVEPFFQEALNQRLKYTMILPFPSQLRKKETQGVTGTSPLVYVITPKKASLGLDLNLQLSDVTSGFNVKFLQDATGQQIKIASSAVRAVRLYSNPDKNEGLYLLFLKEITVDGQTRDLALTITGPQDKLEKHYASLLKAFESSVVSR